MIFQERVDLLFIQLRQFALGSIDVIFIIIKLPELPCAVFLEVPFEQQATFLERIDIQTSRISLNIFFDLFPALLWEQNLLFAENTLLGVNNVTCSRMESRR